MEKTNSRQRSLFLLALLAVLSFVILGRLTQIQIIWGDRYRADYRVGTGGDKVLDTVRGAIISADGKVMARDNVSYDIAVHYPLLKSGDWVESVSELTGESAALLQRRAGAIRRRVERIWDVVRENTQMEDLRIVEQLQYHPVVMDVSRDVAVLVRSAPGRFEGVRIKERTRREYFFGESAPHIVGHCGRMDAGTWDRLLGERRTWTPDMPVESIGFRYRMDDTMGVSGLERRYEDILRGRRGYEAHRLEFHPFRVERVTDTHYPDPGGDLHLTLRADLQEAVMDVLRGEAADPGSGFQSGSVVIMDVDTGGVLAAGTWPSYTREERAGDFASILDREHSPRIFRPAQAAHATGSVYKLITAIAAMAEGETHTATTFNCEGGKTIFDRRFRCLGRHGRIELEEAIERSCNVYFYELALLLSGSQFGRWGRHFGFGRPTGLDWPGATSGLLENPDSVHARVNLSIGQGRFQASTLQVTRAMAAIANGGSLVTPHFVGYALDPQGEVVYRHTPASEQLPVSDVVLDAVRAGMRRTVHGRGGTARGAGLSRFGAAGKTGTAELGAGRPNHAWFAGYAPYDDPKVAFAIVSERTEGRGGDHAAPIMGRILERIWDMIEGAT